MNAPTSTFPATARAAAAATTTAPADAGAAGAPAGVGVVAAVVSHQLPTDPAELKAAAKAAGAPRQVVRFLDGMALPAFVAGIRALDAAGITDDAAGERCGVFTVSGWDPDQHQPELEAGTTPSYETVARHYITTASPVAWLRKMVNNVLCQLSLCRNLRGPNNHVVGGPGALTAILALAQRAVETGTADRVLVLAYDAPAGHESDTDVAGDAAAVVLGPAAPGRRALTVPADRDVGSRADGPANGHGGRAVDVLEALVGELDRG